MIAKENFKNVLLFKDGNEKDAWHYKLVLNTDSVFDPKAVYRKPFFEILSIKEGEKVNEKEITTLLGNGISLLDQLLALDEITENLVNFSKKYADNTTSIEHIRTVIDLAQNEMTEIIGKILKGEEEEE